MKLYYYILPAILLAFITIKQETFCFDKDYEYSINLSNIKITKPLQENDLMLSFDGLDFGFIEAGNIATKNVYITNSGTNKFEISSINIVGREGITFSVLTNYTYPKIVGPGERVKYEIQFAPTFPKNYLDTLLVFVNEPVRFIYRIPLSGASVIENMVWSPDTVAQIGVEQFKLPIRVQNTNKDVFLSGLNYRLVVSFDAQIFFPIGITKGIIENNEVVNGKRILTITDENVSLFGNEQVLTEIIGYVLLGSSSTTLINIVEISWNKEWIRPNSKNGELHTYGLCGNTISQIKWKEDTEVKLDPNPANQRVNIIFKTYENGTYHLQIFSSAGVLCQSETIEIKNPSNEQIETIHNFNLINLTSGLYYIILTNPYSRIALPLSIVK